MPRPVVQGTGAVEAGAIKGVKHSIVRKHRIRFTFTRKLLIHCAVSVNPIFSGYKSKTCPYD